MACFDLVGHCCAEVSISCRISMKIRGGVCCLILMDPLTAGYFLISVLSADDTKCLNHQLISGPAGCGTMGIARHIVVTWARDVFRHKTSVCVCVCVSLCMGFSLSLSLSLSYLHLTHNTYTHHE